MRFSLFVTFCKLEEYIPLTLTAEQMRLGYCQRWRWALLLRQDFGRPPLQ
jgi:hypothetical protein